VSAPRTGYFITSYVSALDDSEQPFALWVPRAYSPRKKYPLLVALHGSDADHRMIPEECLRLPERGFREDVILLSPFGRGDLGWRGPGEADLWDAMNSVKARYAVDARRQYLTGLSMGGYATWRLACAYPGQWAAIAPVCGGGDVTAMAALRKIPVWCVHGERDEAVPVAESRRLVAELRRRKFPHRYDELAGRGHPAWEWLYDPRRRKDSLADWLLKFRRAKAPLPILTPRRAGIFADLFNARIIISHPAFTPIPREAERLRAEAETIARFSFGDSLMRGGRFLVRSDAELTPADLRAANVLVLGRTDNHRWLKQAERKLPARHQRGQLTLRGETYLGKTLLAATLQPSPWNPEKLLGVITYQQFQQMRGAAERFCGPASCALAVNLFDTAGGRYLIREPFAAAR